MDKYRINKRYQARVRKYYELLEKRYGLDPVKRLGWDSRATQINRFDVLCGIGPLQEKSILDVGCGVGDFYGYLVERGFRGAYTGYDLVPAHCIAATEKYGNMFFVKDVLETAGEREFDYVVASGIFSMLTEGWEKMVSATLERMYSLCRIGMAANFLSKYSESLETTRSFGVDRPRVSGIRVATNFRSIYDEPENTVGCFLADPSTVIGICARITDVFKIRHDYAARKNDFTLFAYREVNPANPPSVVQGQAD